MDFLELAEVLTDLKKSSSYEIYKEFNGIVNDEKYKNYCKHISDSEDYKNVKEFCYKFVRNLKEISNMDNEKDRKNRCFHSYSWAYSEISKIFSNGSNKINQSDVLSKLYNIGKIIEKEPHKYIFPVNENQCNKYYNYLQHISSLYDEQDCCLYAECEYYYICYDEQSIRGLMNKFNNCKGAFTNKQPEHSDQTKPIETLSVFQISQVHDRNLPSIEDIKREHDATQIALPPIFGSFVSETDVKPKNDICKIIRGQVGEYPPNSSSCSEGTIPIENYRESLEVLSKENLAVSESECNNLICNPRLIINAVIKTPFGLWLRKRIHKKRKKKYFYKKYEYEFPDNEQEYLYINSYTRRMNLTYYPA
ncbi:PIR Superfamily Protein [Plasmodium ovale wallikeri]|uniref:PIR Superfamily Protein n=1 Tax=Plasmodium ovale wallikeri TaxID=864142 RepID=A0A1A9ALV3_PLAOA|nr:PIR Superfamily Protein [Plasmodium ovale wallikeri]SBT57742.1 PIR Superfamily Protein [Plasmodium ovale wallikeri]